MASPITSSTAIVVWGDKSCGAPGVAIAGLNNYGNGTDTLGNPGRSAPPHDDSIEVRYYNHPGSQAFQDGVLCHG